jgi:succinyl-CoA synthetase beta subunit
MRDAFYYRGTIGLFRPLGGTIGVMLSGGGASLACMDALIGAGGKPANYAEYSGNPPREKVFALARQVLAQPDLTGLWIAGGFANFTRIDETLGGIVDALREVRPKYPIVVRRAGPNDKEGRIMFEAAAKELELDLTFLGRETPMTESARVMSEKARAWEEQHVHPVRGRASNGASH